MKLNLFRKLLFSDNRKAGFLLFLAILIPSFAFAQEYKIGAGDVLMITVYGHKDLDTRERVSGDGKIIFPLLGQVEADGLTVAELSELIADKLSRGLIISPQVSVFVVEFRSRKAVIIGEIVKPGLYEMKGQTTLLELISLAGGLRDDAGEFATIKRTTRDGREVSVRVNLVDIIESGDASRDVPIYDGDSIYITKAGFYYVTGEVKKPNAYKFSEGVTVIKAIAMAGGLTDKASEKKVRIIRKVEGIEKVMENVSMDILVLPEDVIVVPESLF